jgi:hypothetical protein
MAAVVHVVRLQGGATVDIDHKGPAQCTDCGQDAYIRLAGSGGATEAFVCAHCFADRARSARGAKARPIVEPATASRSPRTGSAGGAAR